MDMAKTLLPDGCPSLNTTPVAETRVIGRSVRSQKQERVRSNFCDVLLPSISTAMDGCAAILPAAGKHGIFVYPHDT